MSTVRARPATAAPGGALADYAVGLRFDDLPDAVVAAARRCLVDAVACAIFGSRFPWSRMILAAAVVPGGEVQVPGLTLRANAGKAAYLSGAFAHAFELDSLRKPGAGVHGGATVALPALAMAQEVGASGSELIAAIVAGVEVMFRIGDATLHTAEKRGFHAPGITGVFGSAVACGCLARLSGAQMRNALGLCGSMTGGLLAFAASGSGGMVKRLHLGRAAEGGVEAVRLAACGFEGPAHILEGGFGVLPTFCERHDAARLLDSLGSRFEIEKVCIKRYACHVTAQAAIELLLTWRHAHDFSASDITSIELEVPPKVAAQHAMRRPCDVALAQYSVPFMLAFAGTHEFNDPASLTLSTIADPEILSLVDRISVRADERLDGWAARLRVTLANGMTLFGEAHDFEGCPGRPLSDAALADRFHRLTADRASGRMAAVLAALTEIAALDDTRRLPLADPASAEEDAGPLVPILPSRGEQQ